VPQPGSPGVALVSNNSAAMQLTNPLCIFAALKEMPRLPGHFYFPLIP
jgi:hypothetical protein